jgi:hypothetical protein
MRLVTASFILVQSLFLSIFISYSALSEKACVKSELGKVVCGELVPNKNSLNNSPSPSQRMTVTTQSGVNFTLNGCSKSRTGISCAINIYNSTDFDKEVVYNFFGVHSIIDSEGNEYKTSTFAIGNKRLAKATLPPKLTIKSQIFFKPTGSFNNFVRILRIYPQIDRGLKFDVTFRDFSINQLYLP